MASRLSPRSHWARLALAIALGLTVLTTLVGPFLGDKLANLLPGTAEILIAESDNSGG